MNGYLDAAPIQYQLSKVKKYTATCIGPSVWFVDITRIKIEVPFTTIWKRCKFHIEDKIVYFKMFLQFVDVSKLWKCISFPEYKIFRTIFSSSLSIRQNILAIHTSDLQYTVLEFFLFHYIDFLSNQLVNSLAHAKGCSSTYKFKWFYHIPYL